MLLSFIYEYGASVVGYFTTARNPPPSVTPTNTERPPRRTRAAIVRQRGYVWMTDEKNYRLVQSYSFVDRRSKQNHSGSALIMANQLEHYWAR